MKRSYKLTLSATVLALSVYWVVFPVRVQLQTPRLGIPVIAKAGESFDAVIKTSLPFYFPCGHWYLQDGESQYALQERASHSGVVNKSFTLKLPETLENGGYLLRADCGEGRSVEQRKTVHIIDSVPEAFTMVQLADLPTLGGDESGDKLLRQIISEINIINPNVVLFTGDIAYGGGWDQYRRLVDAMAQVNAPVIAVAGNHEYEGWAGYLHYFIEPYHAVDFGRYKFISLNSGHSRDQMTESQMRWLRQQMSQLNGQTPVVQIHHPVHHTKGQSGYVHVHAKELVRLFNKHKVPIVLSGHWHGDMVFDEHGADRRDTWDFPGTAYVATTTAGADLRPEYSASPPHHGYRIVRLNKERLEFFTYDYDGNGERDPAASIPVGKLNVIKRSDQSVTVENNLNEALPNAKVTITVENGQKLQPNRGKILRQIRRNGVTEVEILVDLPANSQTTITLAKPRKTRPKGA